MADIKISELAEATSLNDSDVLAGVNAAVTRKFSLSRLKSFFFSALTKNDVGLGNVANVLQYSADNKPSPSEIGAVPETRTVNGKALAQNVTLDAADVGAYVKPSGGIPASDLASGVIPTVPSAYTSNPAMNGTASPGSSGAWARGDHVHPRDTSKANSNALGKELHDPAGQNVEYGEYCTYQGNIYIANTAITSSMSASTFISYLDPVNNGGLNLLYNQLAALSEDVATFASGISGTKYIRKRNSIVTVELNNISGLTGHDSVIMTLSQGFRPTNNINFMGFIRSGTGWATATLYLASLYIDTNGVVRVSGNSSQIASGNFYGNATYMI